MKGKLREGKYSMQSEVRKWTKSFYYFKIFHIKSKRSWNYLFWCAEPGISGIPDIHARNIFSTLIWQLEEITKQLVLSKQENVWADLFAIWIFITFLISKDCLRIRKKDEFCFMYTQHLPSVLQLSRVCFTTSFKRHCLLFRALRPIKLIPINVIFTFSSK